MVLNSIVSALYGTPMPQNVVTKKETVLSERLCFCEKDTFLKLQTITFI